MTLLPLDPDQLLSTTRAVRRRLDLTRPVPNDLIRECVAMALQAPSGGNEIVMRFVVVRDPAVIRAVGDVYAQCWTKYEASPRFAGKLPRHTDELRAQQGRVVSSAAYLAEHMGDCPVLVIGYLNRRLDGATGAAAAAALCSVLPGMWSFMLAARARGLGTAWTTIHLMMEEVVADLVGIPYATTQQVCLTPVAWTDGTDFKPALRPDPDAIIDWR
ncbi:MAG: nitroreductase family protein [Dehalococcoidia bacterium]|nr:nitroreductase family protein [Dehalococcoidia bacterium]